jgi:general secretion pathway protein G
MTCPRTSRQRRKHTRRAFTLLEIVVVVTIIALLATLVAPNLLSQIGKSKQRIAQAEVNSIAQQVKLWMVDNGYSQLPDDFDIIMLTETNPPLMREKDLYDPWERRYILVNPGEANPAEFDIWSYGNDGERGGEGEDADVVN